MNYYYIELEDPCDTINSIGETAYGTHANNLICDGNGMYICNNFPETYPDLVIETEEDLSEATAFVNSGEVPIYPLLSGYHPTQKPPIRNK